MPLFATLGVEEKRIYYDKFTTDRHRPRPSKREAMQIDRTCHRGTQPPEARIYRCRSRRQGIPRFDARRYNYYTAAKRKQTHYEDVTVEVQPDPRHYLSQGWLYGFSNGRGGYPLDWTVLKAGADRPVPERFPGSGGKGYDWPAHGWHLFRDPNEESEALSTATTPTSCGSSTRTSMPPGSRRRSSSGTGTGSALWNATSAPGCMSTTVSGCTCTPTPTGGLPRTCTTTRSR